ncbi:MAG: AMP-binding protein, partial [Deltaproteobacteria bacterium]|nr:AMP-binding protein [Deltaproteobacteria bacterium]
MDGSAYKEATTYSYAEFLGEVTRTANMFYDLGIGPGDVVSFLLPNLPQTHFVLWGGQAAGIVNPINPMLNAEVIKDICEHAKSADISSLKFLLCGAAPLSVQLFESFEQNTGMKVVEGYGQTEGTCGSIV